MDNLTEVRATAAHQADPNYQDAVAWIRAHGVRLCAVVLIMAQLWLKAGVLAHGYFRQDDFVLFDWSLSRQFDVMTNYGGHLMPGGMAYAWILARASLYDWTLASILTLALIGASSVALIRLLRTVFGERPAILIPLFVYIFSPLMLPGLSFWSTELQWLPMQLVIFMALNAHISYVRTGRFWHVAVACGWIVVGMAFDDVAALVPLLLFAMTSAFFVPGGWPRTAVEVARRFWRAWALYGVLLAGYLVVFVNQLRTSSQLPGKPGLYTNVLAFISALVRINFVPSALGGPWQWISIGSYAVAAEVAVLAYISWGVAALVVLTSIWFRRHALRAWVILAGWILISAVIPLILGRVGTGVNPTLLGSDVHYLTDSLPVLAICLGLAFWPTVDEEGAYRGRMTRRLRQTATLAVLTAFIVGSLWSYHSYESATNSGSASARSYIATARAAITQAPRGAVVVDDPVPSNIETFFFFLHYAYTSQVVGALARTLPGQHLTWTRAPAGVYRNLMIFDSLGRLWQAAVIGRPISPAQAASQKPPAAQAGHRKPPAAQAGHRKPPAARGCWRVGVVPVRIPIPGTPLFNWPWTLELTYHGPAVSLMVSFGGHQHVVGLPAGSHDAFASADGAGSTIYAQVVAGGPTVCITHMVIGGFVPSALSPPIPYLPVSG